MKHVKPKTTKHLVPAVAVQPGITLARSIEAEGITLAQCAQELGLTLTELEALLSGQSAITPRIAAVLEERWGAPRTT
jgi:plasmid maintenance system antidote protein VapI